jgi:hypothetical protein
MRVETTRYVQHESVLTVVESDALGMRSAPLRFIGNRNVTVKGLTRFRPLAKPANQGRSGLAAKQQNRDRTPEIEVFRAFLDLGQAPTLGSQFSVLRARFEPRPSFAAGAAINDLTSSVREN